MSIAANVPASVMTAAAIAPATAATAAINDFMNVGITGLNSITYQLLVKTFIDKVDSSWSKKDADHSGSGLQLKKN